MIDMTYRSIYFLLEDIECSVDSGSFKFSFQYEVLKYICLNILSSILVFVFVVFFLNSSFLIFIGVLDFLHISDFNVFSYFIDID